jgi:hypothetical protein
MRCDEWENNFMNKRWNVMNEKCDEWEIRCDEWLQNFQMFESSSTIACFDSINKCQRNHILSVSTNECQCNRRMMSK